MTLFKILILNTNFSVENALYRRITFIAKLKKNNISDENSFNLKTLKQKLIDTIMLCHFEFILLMFNTKYQVLIHISNKHQLHQNKLLKKL